MLTANMAASLGHVCKNIKAINAFKSCSLLRHFTDSAAVAETRNVVKFPKRKKRDELSILRALASTVEQNNSSFDLYSYIDDPTTVPTTGKQKEEYLMSKAAGREAAKYVMENYSKFLQHRPMEDFTYTPQAYKLVYEPELPEDTVDGLTERIHLRQTMMAYQSYQKLKDKGEEIPVEVQHDLLELLCFNNSENQKPRIEVEELYVLETDNEKVSSWRTDGPAETVFQDLASPDERAYNSLLKGRAKYKNEQGAWNLYKEMKEKEVKVYPETYKYLLFITKKIEFIFPKVMDLIKGLLQEMKFNQIEPDIHTFNIILQYMSHSRDFEINEVVKVLNEMKHCGIEPTLSTWYYILRTVYRDKRVRGRELICEILDTLEGKAFEPQHPDDYLFFPKAMEVSCSLNELQLAYKVDKLLNHGKNIVFLRNTGHFVQYFQKFFNLMCILEEMDKVILYYERLSTNPVHLFPYTINNMLTAVQQNEAYHYIPRVWSDIFMSQNLRNSRVIDSLLNVIAKRKQEPDLQETFVGITDHFLPPAQEFALGFGNKITYQLDGISAGNCILVYCNAENYDKAKLVFNFYFKNMRKLEGFPRKAALTSLVSLCIQHKDAEMAMNICNRMAKASYESLQRTVDLIKKELQLTDEQKSELDSISYY